MKRKLEFEIVGEEDHRKDAIPLVKKVRGVILDISIALPRDLIRIVYEYAKSVEGVWSRSLPEIVDRLALSCPFALSVAGRSLAIFEIQPQSQVQIWNVQDWSCQYVVRMGEKRYASAGDIVMTNTEIFISDPFNHKIHVLDRTDGRFRRELVLTPEFLPRGLAISGEEMFCYDDKDGSIKVFNHQTGQLRLSWGRKGTQSGQFGEAISFFAYCFMCVSENELFVSDYNNHRVQVFDIRDGTFLRCFGSLGGGDCQLKLPQGITVCGDEVLVCEVGNHRVSVFTRAGKFVRNFGYFGRKNGQFDNPTSVAVIGEMLAVADSANRRIQLFL